MEMTEYVPPESWDDKGMDWSDPDPTRIDYAMAIRLALTERCNAVGNNVVSDVRRISPCTTLSRSALDWCVAGLIGICELFVNTEWTDYADDLSDYPKMWTWRDLVSSEGCEVWDYPPPGSICRGGGRWLSSIRNVIDKLTVIPCGPCWGSVLNRYGTAHDPPMEEALDECIADADGSRPQEFLGQLVGEYWSWTGNTHYKWPIPTDDGPVGEHGYCGYASSKSFRVRGVRSNLQGRDFDLRLAVSGYRSSEPLSYSEVLETAVFDPGRTGYREGLSFLDPIRVRWGEPTDFTIGDDGPFPRNASKPESVWDEKGAAIERHSCWTGWKARVKGILDYGVENGFKFRPKEG